MNFLSNKNLSFLTKTKHCFINFFYSNSYPIFLALIAMLAFCFNLGLLGFTIFIFCACLNLLLIKDLTPFISPVCLFLFCFSNLNVINCFYFYFLCSVCAVCLVAHFYIYPVKFYVGNLTLPLIIFSIALFMGGIFSPFTSNYLNGFAVTFSTGPVILLIYTIFSNYIEPPKNFNLKQYISIVLVLSAVTASISMFYLISIKDIFFHSGLLDLKWGTSNTVASLLLFTTPCVYYLLTKSKYYIHYYLLIAFYLFMLILSGSDGCLGIFLLFSPFLLLISFISLDKSKKNRFLIISSAFFLLVVLFSYYFLKDFDFNSLLNTDDSGRNYLYERAVILYKKYPIFGVGLGYYDSSKYHISLSAFRQFNFHSSILHVLATSGTFGILAYSYYLFARVKSLSGKCRFNLFALTSFLAFQGYALIDVSEFCLFPLLSHITLLITVCEVLNNTYSKNDTLKENFYKRRRAKFLCKF